MGSLRLIITKEAFERSKAKYSANFDAVATNEADKGKFYLVDVELQTTPRSFDVKGNTILVDCATIEQVVQVSANGKEQTKAEQNAFYLQAGLDITTLDLAKIEANMVDRFAKMQNALVSATIEH